MKVTSKKKYLNLNEAQEGQRVILDTGFTCHVGGEVTLHKDALGALFFYCDSGKHSISGQADDGIHCVGIYPK